MPKTAQQSKSATKPGDVERLDQGIRRLALLTKLTWGFLGDQTNALDHDDQLVLIEILEDISVDLQVGHVAIGEESNRLYLEAHPDVAAAIETRRAKGVQ